MAWKNLAGDPLDEPDRFDDQPEPEPPPPLPMRMLRRRPHPTPPAIRPRILGDPEPPVGTIAICPTCQHQVERLITPPNAVGVQLRHWSDCPCKLNGARMQQQIVARAAELQAEKDSALLGDPGAKQIRGLELATFDPRRLQASASGVHPYTYATAWLNAAIKAGESRRTIEPLQRRLAEARGETLPETPDPCLYFHSPGPGRGKTHFAAALYWEAQRLHKRVAFVEEQSFLSLAWNLPLGPDRDRTMRLPAETAWLAVLDDLGRRDPGTGSGVRNVWNDIISRRVNSGGWTIITSNYTPEQLVERGTIDEFTRSRIAQMTGGKIILFHGVDWRQARHV